MSYVKQNLGSVKRSKKQALEGEKKFSTFFQFALNTENKKSPRRVSSSEGPNRLKFIRRFYTSDELINRVGNRRKLFYRPRLLHLNCMGQSLLRSTFEQVFQKD